MDVFFWKSSNGNFGDDLNEWIWDELLPGFRSWDTDRTLTGVGTLLNSRVFPADKPGRFLVAGTGVGYGSPPELGDAGRWDIRSLRGPRSARALGLPETLGVIDPAIMLSEFPEFRDLPRTGRPIFVPHWTSVYKIDWERACTEAEISFVSPRMDAKAVIRAIAEAPFVIAESMHAAIIADTFRTPWTAVSFSPEFNGKKWLDWADSLEISLSTQPVHPIFTPIAKGADTWHRWRRRYRSNVLKAPPAPKKTPLPGASLRNTSLQYRLQMTFFPMAVRGLRKALNNRQTLSSDAVLSRQKARYQDVLDGIIRDYGRG